MELIAVLLLIIAAVGGALLGGKKWGQEKEKNNQARRKANAIERVEAMDHDTEKKLKDIDRIPNVGDRIMSLVELLEEDIDD